MTVLEVRDLLNCFLIFSAKAGSGNSVLIGVALSKTAPAYNWGIISCASVIASASFGGSSLVSTVVNSSDWGISELLVAEFCSSADEVSGIFSSETDETFSSLEDAIVSVVSAKVVTGSSKLLPKSKALTAEMHIFFINFTS